jgi:hypothetical protein
MKSFVFFSQPLFRKVRADSASSCVMIEVVSRVLAVRLTLFCHLPDRLGRRVIDDASDGSYRRSKSHTKAREGRPTGRPRARLVPRK